MLAAPKKPGCFGGVRASAHQGALARLLGTAPMYLTSDSVVLFQTVQWKKGAPAEASAYVFAPHTDHLDADK